MILIIHIIVASTSLFQAALAYVRPSQNKLRVTYGLVAGTLITGFYLVLSKPANMTETCIMGLVYLGIVSVLIVSARHRLVKVIGE